MEKLQKQIASVHVRMAAHDHSDYAGLAAVSEELRVLEAELEKTETRWLELAEALE